MAAKDFPQPVEGAHLEGVTIDTTNDSFSAIFFSDETGKYRIPRVVNDGDAAVRGLPILAGKDSAGNLQYLKVDTDGELVVNIGAIDSTRVYGTATLTAGGSSTSVTNETTAADERFIGVMVSGLGETEWTVKSGTLASETTDFVFHTRPANPSKFFAFPAPIKIASGDSIIVEGLNLEQGGSPDKDIIAHATLIKEA